MWTLFPLFLKHLRSWCSQNSGWWALECSFKISHADHLWTQSVVLYFWKFLIIFFWYVSYFFHLFLKLLLEVRMPEFICLIFISFPFWFLSLCFFIVLKKKSFSILLCVFPVISFWGGRPHSNLCTLTGPHCHLSF